MATILHKLPLFALAAVLTFATIGCELEGGEGADVTDTSNAASQVTLRVFNDAFNAENGGPVTSVDLAVGGSVTFTVPDLAPNVNIVITALGVDTRVVAGSSYTQRFDSAGSYTVTDQNSGAVPKPSVVINVR